MRRNANIRDGMLTKIAIKRIVYVTLDSNVLAQSFKTHRLKKLDMRQKVKPKIILLVQFLFVNVPPNLMVPMKRWSLKDLF